MTWPTTAPSPLQTSQFRLEPLGPVHNERDHQAWMSSIDHIHATPGFSADDWGGDGWPMAMPIERNLRDLEMHLTEFERGEAYAYSVVAPVADAGAEAQVIGCVYIDPDPSNPGGAMVRSWVSARNSELDGMLAQAVADWLGQSWPIASVRFPGRLLDFTP